MSVRIHYDWDPLKAHSNLEKHGVSFEEALTVFADPLALSVVDRLAPANEERWITIGQPSLGGLLVVVHTHVDVDEGTIYIRVISARQATCNEKRQYENEPS